MSNQDLAPVIAAMDTLNMGIMVNLSGQSGNTLKKAIQNISDNQPSRFVVFANIDFDNIGKPNWTEQTVAQLTSDIKNGARGLKIYKSLGLRYKDTNGNRVTSDDVRLDPIWATCGKLGIPVLIHTADPKPFWDAFDRDNERWLELKLRPNKKRDENNPASWEKLISEQHNMFKKHPTTTFINAHMGWYTNNPPRLGELLDEIPNMNVGIGAIIAEVGHQPRQAKAFFIKYQDRILFGKDSWKPEEFPTILEYLKAMMSIFPITKKTMPIGLCMAQTCQTMFKKKYIIKMPYASFQVLIKHYFLSEVQNTFTILIDLLVINSLRSITSLCV